MVQSKIITAALRYVLFPSDLGWMGCVWRGEWIDSLTFGHASREAARQAMSLDFGAASVADEGDRVVKNVIERLQKFAAGAQDDFLDLKLALNDATPFQRKVIERCRRIRAGKVLSYAELAAQAGSPGASRAVGNVMAKNRFPLIVPCHRVVGSGGSLGGYSAPQGLTMKRRLLDREKIQ